MKLLVFFLLLFVAACNNAKSPDHKIISGLDDSIIQSPAVVHAVADSDASPVKDSIDATPQLYANKRFKDVRVLKLSDEKYRITGKAQVFEAAFSWVVEDGHNELKQGHEMTDAGAPEFGNFNFTIQVSKANPNSTLHLILFEASPKDGSRQHELAVPLR